MSTFTLHVYAADRPYYSGECASLVVPTPMGQYGILAHHSNMVAAVIPGMLLLRTAQGETREVAVSNGLIRVENNDVLVLVETAENPDEIDKNRAERGAAEAKEYLLQKHSAQEYRIAKDQIARELNRLRAKYRG